MNSLLHLSSLSPIDFRVDYRDVYSRTFVAPGPIAVEATVKQFFYSIPIFALWMLRLREFIGKRVGLKTANGRTNTLREMEQFRGQIGDRIALFEVWNRNEKEIVTGQRDKHLDFVLVFHLENKEKTHTLQLLTAVQINSWLGTIYFWVVKPIHTVLMPLIIKRLCHRLRYGC